MDINKFMEKSLENQVRIISLLETIAHASSNAAELLGKQQAVVNTVVLSGDKLTSGETDAPSVESTDVQSAEAGNSAATADTGSTSQSGSDTASESTTETAQSKTSEEPQVTQTQESKPESKPESKSDEKPATADDVRAALRDYAKIEGNEAALELLKSHGAASVSALVDLGQEVVMSVIAKAKSVL
ncbi:diguanylate cyclase/phosphodiesterase [Pseudomonas phage ZQG1]|nr:diguanylate cyclase/phosphodiesterase [Pseudomonas phage ZQG1]